MALSVDELSDEQSVQLLRQLARRWLEQDGVRAFVAYRSVQETSNVKLSELSWLDEPAGAVSGDLVKTSRVALATIASGEDADAADWLRKELSDLETGRAQFFDPVSLSILGATLIGCILAARVKKVGSLEFYQGIPPELAKVLKAASGAISK